MRRDWRREGAPTVTCELLIAICVFNSHIGKVHSILVCVPEPGYVILQGTVSPSQRSSAPYISWLVVEACGAIRDAICTCMAG